jgi:WD40 repeat protein
MDFSQDGNFLVYGGGDKTVRLWSLKNRNPLNRNPLPIAMDMKHESVVVSLTMSPDSRRIFSGGIDKKIIIHDAAT